MLIFVIIGAFFMPYVLGQRCNSTLEIKLTPVTLASPNYPTNYARNTRCAWTATAFTDYQLTLSCTVVNIPTGATGCPRDYLQVSRTGRSDFSDATRHCGTQPFTVTSVGSRLTVRLVAQANSPGGRFTCTIKATLNSCNCGRRKTTRIVGGQNSGINEFPEVAGIVDQTNKDIFCGATIITNRNAITAQHCLIKQYPQRLGLIVGEHDKSTGKETNLTAVYNIESYKCYTNCNSTTVNNQTDIAILRTVHEIQMNLGVGLACLPFRYKTNTFVGSTVIVAGWGLLDFGGPSPKIQQKTTLNIISRADCQTRLGANVRVNDTQICTYTPGTDTCQKDSGGGLLFTGEGAHLYVIGVVASGIDCGSNPAINTRVTLFLDWIVSNTASFKYCKN